MKAVTPGDEVAFNRVVFAVFAEAHAGSFAVKVVDLHIVCFINRGQPRCCTCIHQITGDFGLAVNHHFFATSEAIQINAMALAFEQQIKTRMRQALFVHALVNARERQNIHGHLL